MPLILIGLGGAAGAVARYLVDGWVTDRTGATFPWGTLAVNASGTFLLGILFALVVERGGLPTGLRGPVLIGFIGAYTTFSTWMLESWSLIEGGSFGLGLANVVGSTLVGLVAILIGLTIGRALS